MLTNSSFIVQKLGHREVENLEDTSGRANCKSCTWWMGILMMAGGTIIHIIVLPYCDMTLLSANCTIAILINLILSIVVLKESFTLKYDLPAMALIISGTLGVILTSNK